MYGRCFMSYQVHRPQNILDKCNEEFQRLDDLLNDTRAVLTLKELQVAHEAVASLLDTINAFKSMVKLFRSKMETLHKRNQADKDSPEQIREENELIRLGNEIEAIVTKHGATNPDFLYKGDDTLTELGEQWLAVDDNAVDELLQKVSDLSKEISKEIPAKEKQLEITEKITGLKQKAREILERMTDKHKETEALSESLRQEGTKAFILTKKTKKIPGVQSQDEDIGEAPEKDKNKLGTKEGTKEKPKVGK